MPDQRVNYISISIALIACPFFSYKEKNVLTHIIRISDKYLSNGGCAYTNKQLGRRHRLHPQIIANTISKANKLGFVIEREDETIKQKCKVEGRQHSETLYRTVRKLIMKIPEEWELMGDWYNEAFIRDNKEMTEEFLILEKEMKKLEEVTKENILKLILGNINNPILKGGILNYIGGVNVNLIIKDKYSFISKDIKTIITDFLKKSEKLNSNTPPRKIKRTQSLRTKRISPPKKEIKPDPIIEYWNSLPHVHKHKNPDTKVYRAAKRAISILRTGKLINYSWDEEWAKKQGENSIWLKNLSLQFTNTQIKLGLKRISQMLTPGYWPSDKSWLKNMSLANIIYNEHTRKSIFLMVMVNGVKKIEDVVLDNGDEKIKKRSEHIIKALTDHRDMNLNSSDRRHIQYLTKTLMQYYDGLNPDLRSQVDSTANESFKHPMIHLYTEWIYAVTWFPDSVNALKVDNGALWISFQEYVKESYGLEI